MKDLIKDLGDKVKLREITWQEAVDRFNETTGLSLSWDAFRKRYEYVKNKTDFYKNTTETPDKEFETIYGDGTIEAQKIVNLPPEKKSSPNLVLKEMGYDPNEWELVYMTFSNWQQHTKEQTTKQLYAVKFRIKPKQKEITVVDYLKVAKELFSQEIKPLKIEKVEIAKDLDNNLLYEIPGVELHLGKLAWSGDTGENYDNKIAQERFKHIMSEIIKHQQIVNASNCFLSIGNDFFNSDTTQYTTTKGTPQQNDVRWKKMFLIGLRLYTEALITLREYFNKIDVNLVSGNHDEMSSFYLFIALQQHFKDDPKIRFIDDLKKLQCYIFGKNAIFTHHGDKNLKRLIKSIPAEFYKEWGQTIYRELHLGHLHKEVVVDDESGLITRRVGSPSGTDEWHYSERYVGATQKHQTFVWHKEKGLQEIKYINFEKEKVK